MDGYTKCCVKIGQSSKSTVFTAISFTSVKVGIYEMPSESSNLMRFGLTESVLGCPDALMRFSEFGSLAELVGVEHCGTKSYTPAYHTSNRLREILPVVGGAGGRSVS